MTQQAPAGENEYTLRYMESLNLYGGLVLFGRLTPADAAARLIASVDFTQLSARGLYYISMLHRALADSAPDRAVILAELNHAVAQRYEGELSTKVRAECAHAAGRALLAHARRQANDAALFRRATGYLEAALAVFLSLRDPHDQRLAADVAGMLVTCWRGVEDFHHAAEMAATAIAIYERLPPEVADDGNLGAAYGNLGDIQEQLGDLSAAFDNHYRALELFIRARNAGSARTALNYLARLASEVGRFDEALAAGEQGAKLMADLADVSGAIEVHLLSARFAFRIRRFEDGIRFLQRAQDLLYVHQAGEEIDAATLRRHFDLLLWEGALGTMLLGEPSGAFTLERAHQPLEQARRIAIDLGDHDRLAAAIIQLVKLFEHAGQLDQAESYGAMLEHVPASAAHRREGDAAYAKVLLRQGRHADAAALFQRAVAEYGPGDRDRQMVVLYHLGEARLALGDVAAAMTSFEGAVDAFERGRLELGEESRLEVMGNAQEIYERLITLYGRPDSIAFDATRAFYWLERSKSRTLVEAVGLASLPVRGATEKDREALALEGALLDEVRRLRRESFGPVPAGSNRLARQVRLADRLDRLGAVWNTLAPSLPDYINLRRGEVVDMASIREMLTP